MSTTPPTESPGATRKKSARLSKDGRWRSFPRVPHLLQYVSSGVYYARVVSGGKLFRASLNTTVFTTAKLRLADFLRDKRAAPPPRGQGITVGKAMELYSESLRQNASLKPAAAITAPSACERSARAGRALSRS